MTRTGVKAQTVGRLSTQGTVSLQNLKTEKRGFKQEGLVWIVIT